MAWSRLRVNRMAVKAFKCFKNSPLSLADVIMQQSVPLHGLDYPVVEEGEQEDGDHTSQDMDND